MLFDTPERSNKKTLFVTIECILSETRSIYDLMFSYMMIIPITPSGFYLLEAIDIFFRILTPTTPPAPSPPKKKRIKNMLCSYCKNCNPTVRDIYIWLIIINKGDHLTDF